MMLCPNGHEVESKNSYCGTCGARLPATVPSPPSEQAPTPGPAPTSRPTRDDTSVATGRARSVHSPHIGTSEVRPDGQYGVPVSCACGWEFTPVRKTEKAATKWAGELAKGHLQRSAREVELGIQSPHPMVHNESSRSAPQIPVAALVGIVAVVGVVVWALARPSNGDGIGARNLCRTIVKQQLVAPSTAQFSGESGFTANKGPWQIAGSVDSENGFGAMLRSTYSCRVTFSDGEYHGHANVIGN